MIDRIAPALLYLKFKHPKSDNTYCVLNVNYCNDISCLGRRRDVVEVSKEDCELYPEIPSHRLSVSSNPWEIYECFHYYAFWFPRMY